VYCAFPQPLLGYVERPAGHRNRLKLSRLGIPPLA
jgi:hypothetical protein